MKILTIRLGAVGDVVTVYPALAALRRMFADAVLHHLVEEGAAGVVKGLSGVDDVIVVRRAEIKRQAARLRSGELRALRRRLRDERYDVVIDFQSLQRSAWFAWWTNAPTRVARRNWRELNPMFFTHTVATSASDNVVLQYLELLRPLSPGHGAVAAQPLAPPFASADRDAVRELRRRFALDGPFVVFAPGSRWPRRALPPPLIVALGKVLASRGVRFVLVGGQAELGLQGIATQQLWPASFDLPLTGVSALLAEASGFVGADSAPMHLADMSRVPSVVVYGPSSPHLYGPVFAPHVDVRDARFGSSHDFRGSERVDYFSGIDAAATIDALQGLMQRQGIA